MRGAPLPLFIQGIELGEDGRRAGVFLFEQGGGRIVPYHFRSLPEKVPRERGEYEVYDLQTIHTILFRDKLQCRALCECVCRIETQADLQEPLIFCDELRVEPVASLLRTD